LLEQLDAAETPQKRNELTARKNQALRDIQTVAAFVRQEELDQRIANERAAP